jgi:hypothetical protein
VIQGRAASFVVRRAPRRRTAAASGRPG